MSDILVTPQRLVELLGEEDPPVLLDVRWRLGGPPGHAEYLAGHLPGAVYVDLDTELARPGGPGVGRHPLPDPADLQRAARRWGVGATSTVVAYDATGNLAAARAWWLLRWAGLTRVHLLDGGLAAWTRAGGGLATDDVVPVPGDVELSAGAMATLEVDDVPGAAVEGVLLDARAGERYRGETEPVDPVAGHVPGALSAPTTDNLAPDGTFLDPAALRDRFAALGVRDDRPVATYCGSGITAAHQVVALALAGHDAALYPGSWSQWSTLGRPVATGPDAG